MHNISNVPPKSGKYQDDGSCCPFLFLFKAKKEVGHYLYTVYILKIHFWIINDLIIKINLLFKGFSEIFKSSFRWNSFLKLVHESFCLERNEQLSLPWKHCCGLTKRSSVPFQSGRCWCLYQTVVIWFLKYYGHYDWIWCLKRKLVEKRKWLYCSFRQKVEKV